MRGKGKRQKKDVEANQKTSRDFLKLRYRQFMASWGGHTPRMEGAVGIDYPSSINQLDSINAAELSAEFFSASLLNTNVLKDTCVQIVEAALGANKARQRASRGQEESAGNPFLRDSKYPCVVGPFPVGGTVEWAGIAKPHNSMSIVLPEPPLRTTGDGRAEVVDEVPGVDDFRRVYAIVMYGDCDIYAVPREQLTGWSAAVVTATDFTDFQKRGGAHFCECAPGVSTPERIAMGVLDKLEAAVILGRMKKGSAGGASLAPQDPKAPRT